MILTNHLVRIVINEKGETHECGVLFFSGEIQ